ncbi:hypothetical protein EVA_18500 [gut metagenome]|uniref:Uncharacterized protein n=1 Tax=gut metagenome TaxID=749906 RepID=J9FUY3_9ZZZZ
MRPMGDWSILITLSVSSKPSMPSCSPGRRWAPCSLLAKEL